MVREEKEGSKDLVERLDGSADYSRWKYLIVGMTGLNDEFSTAFSSFKIEHGDKLGYWVQ